ncbi:MAG: hypothetical protein V4482_02025 [Pseudomonadota bacterium]
MRFSNLFATSALLSTSRQACISLLSNTTWKKYLVAIAAISAVGGGASYAGTSVWDVVSPDETTLTGLITATTLNKTGSGVGIIAPSGTNAISAAVVIQAGTLQLNAATATAFGTANAAIPITIYDGATLIPFLSGGMTLANNIVIGSTSATGNITGLGYTGSALGTTAYAVTLSGQISEPVSCTNILALGGGTVSTGANIITLSGNNSGVSAPAHPLTGGISVGGNTTLCIGGANAIPATGSITLAATGAVLSATVTPAISVPSVTLSAAGTVQAASGITLTLGAITGSTNTLAVGTSGNTGTVVLTGANTTGAISVNYGTLQLGSAGTCTLASSQAISLAAATILALNTTGTPTFASPITFTGNAVTITAAVAATLSGALTGSSTGGLTINGAAIVTLSGTQVGAFTTTVGGTAGLKIGAAANVGTGAIVIGAGTSFQATGNTTITNAITFG